MSDTEKITAERDALATALLAHHLALQGVDAAIASIVAPQHANRIHLSDTPTPDKATKAALALAKKVAAELPEKARTDPETATSAASLAGVGLDLARRAQAARDAKVNPLSAPRRIG